MVKKSIKSKKRKIVKSVPRRPMQDISGSVAEAVEVWEHFVACAEGMLLNLHEKGLRIEGTVTVFGYPIKVGTTISLCK